MGTYFIPHLLPEFKKFLENKDYVGLLDFLAMQFTPLATTCSI